MGELRNSLPVRTDGGASGIGFAEFTSKLVSDTFATLVSAQNDQIEAYIQLVEQTALTLSDYINDTQDDIGGQEIVNFLMKSLPSLTREQIESKDISAAKPEEKAALEAAAKIDEDELTDLQGTEAEKGAIVSASDMGGDYAWDTVINALKQRISVNKYKLLIDMVEMGLVRLVVDKGTIETSLKFHTLEDQSSRFESEDFGRKGGGFSAGFSFSNKIFNISAGGSYSKLNVTTDKRTVTTEEKEELLIEARVKINFKSDYKALNDEN